MRGYIRTALRISNFNFNTRELIIGVVVVEHLPDQTAAKHAVGPKS